MSFYTFELFVSGWAVAGPENRPVEVDLKLAHSAHGFDPFEGLNDFLSSFPTCV
jgi:hypothetical protein